MLIRRNTTEKIGVVAIDAHRERECRLAVERMRGALYLLLALHKVEHPNERWWDIKKQEWRESMIPGDRHRIGLTGFELLEAGFGSAIICSKCFSELCSTLGPDASTLTSWISKVPQSTFVAKIDNWLAGRRGR
jgi:hypothetical protein